MYQGRVLEIGTTHQVLKEPKHPYTQGLLAAIPGIAPPDQRLSTISDVVGDVDIISPYPLATLRDGRQVSLPPELLRNQDVVRGSATS